MKRYGSVVEVKKDRLEEYKRLHVAVWPAVLEMISECNLKNYSIYLRKFPDGKLYLFSYFEYVGANFEADCEKMASDKTTQAWWDICKPCHIPFEDRADNEWWASMDEVFHQD